jgi:hypothetical protein
MITIPHPDPLEELAEQTWPVLVALARAPRVKDAELQPTLDDIVVCLARSRPRSSPSRCG